MSKLISKEDEIKASVFISHAASEADIIHRLVKFLKAALPEVSFFVSSSYDSLSPGVIWWDELRKKLSNVAIVLACVSRQSIGRPWILFESGVGYGCNAQLIPVILDDLPKLELPLSMFQAVRLDDKAGIDSIVKLIAKKTSTKFRKSFLKTPLPRFSEIPISVESSSGVYLGIKKYDITSGWERYVGNHHTLQIFRDYVSLGESFDDGFRYPSTDSLFAPWQYLAFRIKCARELYLYAVLKCVDGSMPKIFVSSIVHTWGFTGNPTDEFRVPVQSRPTGKWQVIIVDISSLQRQFESPIQAITGFRARGQLLLSHIWCVEKLISIPEEFMHDATKLSYPSPV